MRRFFPVVLTLFVLLVTASVIMAQWPSDPATNLVVCDRNGSQATPIIQSTSDGGCFVVWYDHSSGNYDVCLQYYDAGGVAQWADNGMLISDHSMTGSITEWDMKVDVNDNAIIVTNDIRDGDDWDIFAYSIATDGTFNWGDDGIQLSENGLTDVGQWIQTTSDGNVYIAWQQETDDGTGQVVIHGLDEDGEDVFNDGEITVDMLYTVSIPRMAETSDGFLLLYLVQQSTSFMGARSMYLQRYSTSGEAQWEDEGAAVHTTSGIGPWHRPDLVSDGDDGAVIYWYDSHSGNTNHVYVQHVDSDGNISWDADGVQVSTANTAQTSPTLAYVPDTGNFYVFYPFTNTGQTESGFGAQYFNADGERQWDDSGVVLSELGGAQHSQPSAFALNDGSAIVMYLEYEDATHMRVKAIKLNTDGEEVWDTSPVELTTTTATRSDLMATKIVSEQIVGVWGNGDVETSDIYLQNVNPDGSLGTAGPGITITSPESGVTVHELPVVVTYAVSNFVVADEGGDGVIELTVQGTSDPVISYTTDETITLTALDEWTNTITLRLVDYDHEALDPDAFATIQVTYDRLEPSIVINSPNDDTEVIELPLNVTFTVVDFTVAEEGGDGVIELTVQGDGDPETSYTTAEEISIETLDAGFNTITLGLVDYDHNALIPDAMDAVTVEYTPPPQPEIAITSPMNNDEITEVPLEVVFTVTNLEIGPDAGSIRVHVNDDSVDTWTSTDPGYIDTLASGNSTIVLQLVNAEGELLEAMASVGIVYTPDYVLEQAMIPNHYGLEAAYPNPFNPSTTINYAMKADGIVKIEVYDILGRSVAVLVNGVQPAGIHTINWLSNDLASGIYFVRMNAGQDFVATMKLVRMK